MINESVPTLRLRTTTLRVVIVHDDVRACLPLADALGKTFIVQLARGTGEMVEQLPPDEGLTCIVGVLSSALRARDVHEQFVAAGGKPERIVFVTKQDLAQQPVLEETIDVVRRLGDQRFY